MKPRNRLHTTVWGVLFASLLVLGGSSARLNSSQKAWGEVASGLQMTIHLNQAEVGQLKTPKFRVELCNAGESDLVLNMGMMLANGQKQYPNAVVLTLTDAQGKTRRLNLREPAAVRGRMDPLILPIPVGATFAIPADLDNYWAAASKEFDCKLKPGSYSLEAPFTGRGVSQREANLDVKGIALMSYWMGTVTSNRLEFEVRSQ
jgi:hypothetical protein